MSLIQFPEDSILLAESSLAANAMTLLAELDDLYPSGLGIYIVNNSPFTTALVNVRLVPTQNTNVAYSRLYNQSIYLEPQQALIITNPLNSANVEVQVNVDNASNVSGYVIYNPNFQTYDINGYTVLPLDALVQTTISDTGNTSGIATVENLQQLQTYVTGEVNSLQSTVSSLSAIITDHFEELLDAVNFQTEVNNLCATINTEVRQLSADVSSVSAFVQSSAPAITAFLENTAPALSSAFDQLSNQVLSNYQTFTDLNLSEVNRLNNLTAQRLSDFNYLTSEMSQLSSYVDSNIQEIIIANTNSQDTAVSALTTEVNTLAQKVSTIETEISNIGTANASATQLQAAISANQTSINNLNSQFVTNVESVDSQLAQLQNVVNINSNSIYQIRVNNQNSNANIQNVISDIDALSSNVIGLDSNLQLISEHVYNANEVATQASGSVETVNLLVKNVSSELESAGLVIYSVSAGVDHVSSIVDSVSASLENGTLNPQFASIQRNTQRVSQNWLPNSTFLYGLLKWTTTSSGVAAATISPCTSLLCTENNTALSYIESDLISPQWMDGSEKTIALSLQMSNKVASAPSTAEVLCYDNNLDIIGSVALLSLSAGEDNTYLSAIDTLPTGTTSAVIRLGFSGSTANTNVSFSEIKFEYNNEPTLWSDEASSVIINDLYNKVYGAGSVTVQ